MYLIITIWTNWFQNDVNSYVKILKQNDFHKAKKLVISFNEFKKTYQNITAVKSVMKFGIFRKFTHKLS